MRRFALPLGLIAFALACTDATSPDRQAALAVKNPTVVAAVLGDKPPPPVDAAIIITVSSTPVTGLFTGVYFANASVLPSVVAALDAADPDLAFNGTAWLRLDNQQPFGPTASANARFQNTSGRLSGKGTLVILGHTITIDQVTSFTANPDCHLIFEPCAVITFDATVDGESGHHGTADAFDRQVCTPIFDEGGNLIGLNCPEIGS